MPFPNRRPARQWRITITERTSRPDVLVTLQWRTFPARADEWHGIRHQQVVPFEPPIRSAEDLEAVLAAAVDGEWWPDVRRTYPPPPDVSRE